MKVQKNAKSYKAVQHRGSSAPLPRLASRRIVSLLAAGSLLMTATHPAAAATRTWTGNTTTNWSTVDGFDGVPVTGDLLVFNTAGAAGPALNNDLAAATIFASMTFNPGASSYTITNPKTYLTTPTAYITSFTTGVTNNSGVLQVLNLDVGLQNGAVLAGSNFELAAAITSSATNPAAAQRSAPPTSRWTPGRLSLLSTAGR